MNAPHTMVYVIVLITELLPLPLPIESVNALNKDQCDQAIRIRKLWSAHLYSLGPIFHEIIHRLGLATHPLLTHSLRRMCVALSDLSAPMALLVAKAVLDLVLQAHRSDQRTSASNTTTSKEDPSVSVNASTSIHISQQTMRSLNMLASLVSHAPTKAAVIHLLFGGSPNLSSCNTTTNVSSQSSSIKIDEKYGNLVTNWCNILSYSSPKILSPGHLIAAQESLLSVVGYLTDCKNSMQNYFIKNEDEQDKCINAGVLPKELLMPFLESLVDLMKNPNSSVTLILHALQILNHIIEESCGFYYVKR